MVRKYCRKTTRGLIPHDLILTAIDHVINNQRSIRSVAVEMGISTMTLCRYVKQAKAYGIENITFRHGTFHPVFSKDQENILQDYLVKAANIYFGLAPVDVRFLAYECALAFKIDMPASWKRDKLAGPDWFS